MRETNKQENYKGLQNMA